MPALHDRNKCCPPTQAGRGVRAEMSSSTVRIMNFWGKFGVNMNITTTHDNAISFGEVKLIYMPESGHQFYVRLGDKDLIMHQ